MIVKFKLCTVNTHFDKIAREKFVAFTVLFMFFWKNGTIQLEDTGQSIEQ